MKTRHGCLAGLVAIAIVGAWATWTAGWGDDGAGTRLAFGLGFGLVVVYVGVLLESVTKRSRKQPLASHDQSRPPADEV